MKIICHNSTPRTLPLPWLPHSPLFARVRLTLINKGNAFIVLLQTSRRCDNDASEGDTVPFTSKKAPLPTPEKLRASSVQHKIQANIFKLCYQPGDQETVCGKNGGCVLTIRTTARSTLRPNTDFLTSTAVPRDNHIPTLYFTTPSSFLYTSASGSQFIFAHAAAEFAGLGSGTSE